MRCFFAVLCLALCASSSVAQDVPDFAIRLAEFELQAAQLDECSSVLVHEVYIASPATEELGPTVIESIYRRMTERALKARRFDQEVLSNGYGSATVYNSILQSDREILFSTALSPGGNVKRLENVPLREARADSDFLLLPLADVTGLSGGLKRRLSGLSKFRVMSERLQRGDTYRTLLISPNGKALIEYVFAAEPTWAPVRMTSRINPGEPVDVATVTVEDCAKWKEFCRTETQWVRISKDDVYAPDHISMWSEGVNVDLEFVDWRLGKNVDSTLMDPLAFIEEGIAKTVDFDRWYSMFEAKKEQARRRK